MARRPRRLGRRDRRRRRRVRDPGAPGPRRGRLLNAARERPAAGAGLTTPTRARLDEAPDAPLATAIADAVAEAGGRALVVGGWVRDALRGEPASNLDLEVLGLAPDALESLLARFGRIARVGRSFGVWYIAGSDLEVALPRRHSAPGAHTDWEPGLSFEQAARRRDLTINSMGFDPRTGELLDPHGGRVDLAAGVLRPTDAARFGDDPLRGLRAAAAAARFGMRASPELIRVAGELDLSGLPAERILGELGKIVRDAARPSLALGFLRDTRLLRFLPELAALVDVPQDPRWHPEGDVWIHTAMALDAAVGLRTGDPADDEALGFGVLMHDLGKPATTVVTDDRITSHGHAERGAEIAHEWLARLRASTRLTGRVEALVRHHLAPSQLVAADAGARAYRRLSRRLESAGVSAALLERVARADHLGRTTEDARAGRYPAGDRFLEAAAAAGVEDRALAPAVLGRHLIARGLTPGPRFGAILRACREDQDATGDRDPEAILDRVLARPGAGSDSPPENG